jgi:hypothetical protein
MASLFVEGSVVGVSAMMLFDRARVLELGRRPAEGRVSRLAA